MGGSTEESFTGRVAISGSMTREAGDRSPHYMSVRTTTLAHTHTHTHTYTQDIKYVLKYTVMHLSKYWYWMLVQSGI